MAYRRLRLAQRRKALGLTQEELAEKAQVDRATVGRWERGDCEPQPWQRPRLARALQVPLEDLTDLLALVQVEGGGPNRAPDWSAAGDSEEVMERTARGTRAVAAFVDDDRDEFEALELARRVEASDISPATLQRLESAVDNLAVGYATMPAADLRNRIRRHQRYVAGLLDARATLAERRRLLVVSSWLSLLAATVDIDLRHDSGATAWLATCQQVAEHVEHGELHAWCLETRAWQLLGGRDYQQAAELSRAAQRLAPTGSSALIQATAQEGRSLARLGDAPATRKVLRRIEKLVSTLPAPDRPEHHYRYDPDKALSYTATTLAWLGDPAAVAFAAEVAERLQRPTSGPARPRRAALARLDLALALLGAGRPDEAADAAQSAITAGMLVASNYWRAAEVVTGVEQTGVPQAAELRDAYETYRPPPPRQAPQPPHRR